MASDAPLRSARLPTPAEFTTWVNLLEANGGNVTEVLVVTILTSTTFAQHLAAE